MPEQARGLPVAREPTFSFGVVFYEMLTGRQPFAGETTSDVIAAILKSEPQPLSIHSPDVSLELEHVVKKALGKDREERYQVIKDLLLDLKMLQRDLSSAEASRTEFFPTADESAGKTQTVAPLKTEGFAPKKSWLWLALPALVLLAAFSVWFLRRKPPETDTNFLSSLAASQITSWKSELGEGDLSGAIFHGRKCWRISPQKGKKNSIGSTNRTRPSRSL